MGRPTKLTPAAQERFLQAIAAGAFAEVAARHAGFSPASMYRYLRGSSSEQLAFREAVSSALATLELRLIGTVARAALDDPKWALILLEKRFPERWAMRPRADDSLEPSSDVESPADRVVLDPLQAEVLLPRLLEAGARLRGAAAGEPVDLERFVDRGTAPADAADGASE